jgi:hypothetical protein
MRVDFNVAVIDLSNIKTVGVGAVLLIDFHRVSLS